jgi:hypothetical protein
MTSRTPVLHKAVLEANHVDFLLASKYVALVLRCTRINSASIPVPEDDRGGEPIQVRIRQ